MIKLIKTMIKKKKKSMIICVILFAILLYFNKEIVAFVVGLLGLSITWTDN